VPYLLKLNLKNWEVKKMDLGAGQALLSRKIELFRTRGCIDPTCPGKGMQIEVKTLTHTVKNVFDVQDVREIVYVRCKVCGRLIYKNEMLYDRVMEELKQERGKDGR